MDVYVAVKNYLSKMITAPGSGMKVLLLDEITLKIISLVSSMSEIMRHEVYLIERITQVREPVSHLSCICFLRPTEENVAALSAELRSPNYRAYYLFFSHALTKHLLKQLAEADEHELVTEVNEFYADFMPLSPFLFELDMPNCLAGSRGLQPNCLNRCFEGITSLLLALRVFPTIRYQNASEACRQVAESVRSLICRETVLFDFGRQSDQSSCDSLLLILDRRQDPVTPLLAQWTYEAMIHELIGIHQNRVELSRVPNIRPELKEITLSREFDNFYCSNQFANFGEIGQSIKKLVENFQKASKMVDTKQVESIADLKKFLENFPSFRKVSGTVETHVTIVSELSRMVKEHALLDVSEVEQELVCHDSHSTSLGQIRGLLNDPRIRLSDALRLVLLYALRYEVQKKELETLTKSLSARGASNEDLQMIHRLLEFSGSRARTDELNLFSAMKSVTSGTNSLNGQTAKNAMASWTKRLVKGLKGVDNVYTQHEPLLTELLTDTIKGKLRETAFPCLSATNTWSSASAFNRRPRKVIVFIIGGLTYEEVHAVHKLNTTTPDVDIIIGGTCVHNSWSFLEEVSSATKGCTSTSYYAPIQQTDTQSDRDGHGDSTTGSTFRSFGKFRSHIRYGLLK